MRSMLFSIAAVTGLVALASNQASATELEPKYKECVNKGLVWLARQQNSDGRWEAAGRQYPVTMTALGGMAMLMEGSTLREGKYADNIRKAVDWLMSRSQTQGKENGLLGDPRNAEERERYMYGHGFGLLFLACVYGEEDDVDKRRKLEDVLTRAVQYSGKAQTNRGGWGYVSAAEGNNFDEGSVTITQLQSLRAARNAGIAVPVEIINNAKKYLKDCTNHEGGVIYSLAHGGNRGDARPALTAAAVSCGFSAGEYNSDEIKKWIGYCVKKELHKGFGHSAARHFGHDEYTHYYFAQALYCLGEDGYAKLFPEAKVTVTWSEYRKSTFETLRNSQTPDGTSAGFWSGGGMGIGPVYVTAMYLAILQLDNAVMPIYMR